MERRTSSRDRNTGDTMDETWTGTTPRRSTRVSREYPMISMQQWCGVETARFTSIREASSGDSTRSKDHQLSRPIPNLSPTGKEFLTTLMLLYNTPTVTLTSSRVTNTTDSMTEHLRWVYSDKIAKLKFQTKIPSTGWCRWPFLPPANCSLVVWM